ncbi:MAG TPA: restriction endonuclease [Tissierella sp.]|uniref:PmeII family type II restriction endonuclease n=1 Tax=Tissierella praeacuta TaxID=43131 RepID=UPI000EEC75DB|nr:PmeII family type II restriction endonuclease [Tissierella praeacuta]HAE91469.1 restriction endonuclease [Tissierella sp.]
MNEQERQKILNKAKEFFRSRVADNHIKNTKKLTDINKFNINPFTLRYLSNFAFGDSTPENMAKALLYPRVLGTSISTTFGTQLQYFCNEVLSSYASTTSGIDIEFLDAIDGRRKYCQIKSGPNTINHDDITTIFNHFTAIKNLARTNRMTDFNPLFDCIIGVFYGTEDELNASYRTIARDYPVFIGQDFWHRLTGDKNFYFDLINAFAEVAVEMDSTELINNVLQELTQQIRDAEL